MPEDQPSDQSSEAADNKEFYRRLEQLSPFEGRPGQRFFEPLGEFVIEFNRFELYLHWALEALARPHNSEAGSLPLAYVKTVAERGKLLHQLALRRFPNSPLSIEATRIYKAMRKINAFRNTMIHGQWKSLGGSASGGKTESGEWEIAVYYGASILYFDSTDDGSFQVHKLTPDAIRKKINELNIVSRALFNLTGDIRSNDDGPPPGRDEQSASPSPDNGQG